MLLEKLVDGEFKTLAKLEGLFAALHISVEFIKPSEFFPLVIGEQGFPDAFKTIAEVNDAISLLLGFWNNIGERFRAPPFVPNFDEDDEGEVLGEAWVSGFLEGVAYSQGFDELIEDEIGIQLFAPIFLIAHQNGENPALSVSDKPVTKETRPKILTALVAAINHMYQMNLAFRANEFQDGQINIQPSKLGRNDTCRCGSGKKYKKCCLK